MNNLPLCEKYRPSTFEDVVGVKDIETLKSIVKDPSSMPNLLFYGPQGVGKTACAKIIISLLKPIDVIKINGSDERGIDVVRDKILAYGQSQSSVKGKPKIIFIDEVDGFTPEAFKTLRGSIEEIIKNARFICTANYLNKIPGPIQSRFSLFEFAKPTKEDMIKRVKQIIETEKIEAGEKEIELLVTSFAGDLRACINALQFATTNEDRKLNIFELTNNKSLAKEVYQLIEGANWSKIRYEMPLKSPDYVQLLVELDELFFNSAYPIEKKVRFNEVIAEGVWQLSLSFNPSITFSAVCHKLIMAVQQ